MYRPLLFPLTLVSLLSLCSAAGSAQTYTLSPGDTLTLDCLLEDYQDLVFTQDNISAGTIQLKWEKISASVPAGWDMKICDNKLCYNGLEQSEEMLPVGPGGKGILALKVNPRINPGTAVVRYAVWDMAVPSLRDTLTWIVRVVPTGVKDAEETSFSAYYSQAGSAIIMQSPGSEVYSFMVSDMSGRVLVTGQDQGVHRVEMGNFSEGIYSIRYNVNNSFGVSRIVIRHD
jgi:hypothetical protein